MFDTTELDPKRVRLELENVYMLARMKRAKRHRYNDDGSVAGMIGPKSDDPDWDNVITMCERAGLKSSIVRTVAAGSTEGTG